ncbi:MAG: class I tRNA ligase family protein [Victivallis sp.]
MVLRFQSLWERLGITNDRYIRTTEEFHKRVVRQILQELFDRRRNLQGRIHRLVLRRLRALLHGEGFRRRQVSRLRAGGFGHRRIELFLPHEQLPRMADRVYRNASRLHPALVPRERDARIPAGKGLGDLCISRPKSRLSWGIELPFDPDYVCYVWFDALINYISGVGYLQDDAMFEKWWPASYHLIGKDILTTHSVYWPTMLKAIGLPMPKTIFAHGWWLTGSTKMSKSLGNVINPMDMVDRCGVDAFRYFLMAEMSPGNDANFTEESFVARYNSDLANDLGNLLSRVLKMTLRSTDGVISLPGAPTADEEELNSEVSAAIDAMETSLAALKFDQGIAAAMNAVRAGNRYMEKTAPWTLAKKGETERLNTVLYTAANALRQISAPLYPVMPEKYGRAAQGARLRGR